MPKIRLWRGDRLSTDGGESFHVITGFSESVSDALENRRLIVLLPFCAITGLIAYRSLAFDPHPIALLCIMGLLTAVLRHSFNQILVLRGFICVLAFWIGFSLLAIQGALVGTPMLAYASYGQYEAEVDAVLRTDESGQRIVVTHIVPLGGARGVPIRKARLFVRDGVPLARGDIVRGSIRFAPVPGPIVPGGFDSQFQGYFDGIGAFGNSTSTLNVVSVGKADARRLVATLRQSIGSRIDLVLQQPASGIARALTIGDQSQISDETRDVIAAAGLAHVLAISGLHLTLVAGGVFAGIRLLLALSHHLSQRYQLKKIAAIGGMTAALIYLTLAGASVSATRATIMLMLVFGAVLAGRRALTMRNVALAAIFVIVTDPASIFRPSFQLSFSAVAALVGVYETTRRGSDENQGIVRGFFKFFGSLAATSLIAGLATALFAAYHFQQTAPLGVLGNLVALPLVGFVILPAAFMAVLAMPLGIEAPFLLTMGWGIDRIVDIAGYVAVWSSSINASPLLFPSALVIGFLALGWFSFLLDRYRYFGPIFAVPLIFLFGLDQPPDVLIADSTKAVAVRSEDGLALISGRIGSFATNAWSETYQLKIAQKFDGVQCDGAGCIAYSAAGFTVALVKRREAFDEDCRFANLVVTRIDAPSSCADDAQVVDRGDLDSGGVHWLRWNEGKADFDIRPAITDIHRPWRAQR